MKKRWRELHRIFNSNSKYNSINTDYVKIMKNNGESFIEPKLSVLWKPMEMVGTVARALLNLIALLKEIEVK